jgi:hypothetical protein
VRLYRPLGWQSSCFLTDRAEAERAYTLAEQLGSVNAAAAGLASPGRRYATPVRRSSLVNTICLRPLANSYPMGWIDSPQRDG